MARIAAIFSLLFLGGCGESEPAPPGRRAVAAAPAEAAGPWFVDEAAARGIDLLDRTGRPRVKELIMGAVGPGAAVFDANGDGRLDVYVPNGNMLVGPGRTELDDGADRPRNALFIQREDGTFVDEAAARGVDDDRWSFGACAADLDDDGDQDLVVTNFGPNRLYVNDGAGRFTDVAVAAGVAGPAEPGRWEWTTGIAIGDVDGDGRLDLYLAQYADLFRWLRETPSIRRDASGGIVAANVCTWQRLTVYCGPEGLPAVQDRLLRGAGGRDAEMRFEDIGRAAGIELHPDANGVGGPRYGFQPVIADVDGDGRPDIYVANDSVPSSLFLNRGDGTFTERAFDVGVALGDNGEDLAGMGVDVADVTGDGRPDLLKTNFALQTNNVYVAEAFDGRVLFRDHSIRMGLEEVVYRDLSWGVLAFDYDNDGDRDVFFANGHVYPEVDLPEAAALKTSFEQYNRLFRNEDGALRAVADAGPGLEIRKCSRGAAWLDVDDDGDLDLIVTNLNATPDLLINRRGAQAGHWLRLRLVGDPAQRVNRDAIGTRIRATAGGRTQVFLTVRGRSFLSCCDPRVHIGLGAHTGPLDLEITWPDGHREQRTIARVDREVEVRR